MGCPRRQWILQESSLLLTLCCACAGDGPEDGEITQASKPPRDRSASPPPSCGADEPAVEVSEAEALTQQVVDAVSQHLERGQCELSKLGGLFSNRPAHVQLIRNVFRSFRSFITAHSEKFEIVNTSGRETVRLVRKKEKGSAEDKVSHKKANNEKKKAMQQSAAAVVPLVAPSLGPVANFDSAVQSVGKLAVLSSSAKAGKVCVELQLENLKALEMRLPGGVRALFSACGSMTELTEESNFGDAEGCFGVYSTLGATLRALCVLDNIRLPGGLWLGVKIKESEIQSWVDACVLSFSSADVKEAEWQHRAAQVWIDSACSCKPSRIEQVVPLVQMIAAAQQRQGQGAVVALPRKKKHKMEIKFGLHRGAAEKPVAMDAALFELKEVSQVPAAGQGKIFLPGREDKPLTREVFTFDKVDEDTAGAAQRQAEAEAVVQPILESQGDA